MSTLSIEELEKLLTELQSLISLLQRDGFNIGVDSYCTVHNLLLALATQGVLTNDFSKLRTLIAPVLCCSEKEQEIFNRYFDDWLQVLQAQPIPPIIEALAKIEQEQKRTKKSYLVLSFLVVLGFAIMPFGNYLGEMISSHLFAKFHPAPVPDIVIVPRDSNKLKFPPNSPTQAPVNSLPKTPPEFALWATLAVLALTLLWYLIQYIQLQRFLNRHSALQPPDLSEFFLKNEHQNLYSPVTFARTAQQLHKHRDIDAQLLDVEATIKCTILKCGFYSPVYKAIKALPEYLVLIDRASFNDQLSQFVDSLLKELDDFGLFIERYYFDSDPRCCYPARQPTKPCTLECLQSLYTNHRLIIFSDSRHFLDPITNKVYDWLGGLQEWHNPFLFTLESPQHWDYYKQQLHEAGFVVLATGQKGFEELVSYVSVDRETRLEQRGDEVDCYPYLLQQRPRRFLERHPPTPEITAELLTQLHEYLDGDGFVWLTACAVYPELHWQLTLYLGEKKEQKQFDDALLLRLARLPWFRYGYMPDWIRLALLLELKSIDPQEEQKIRSSLEKLLSEITKQKQGDDVRLTVVQKLLSSYYMFNGLIAWSKINDSNNPFHDYVFQSFMAGKLGVKAPKTFSLALSHFFNRYTTIGMILLIGVSAHFYQKKLEEKQKQEIAQEEMKAKEDAKFVQEMKAKEEAELKAKSAIVQPPVTPISPQSSDSEKGTSDCSKLDSDGDGINNCDDKCPNTLKGTLVNRMGCWIVDIKFDNDRSEVKPQYFPLLDNLADEISNFPNNLVIEVQGHVGRIVSAPYAMRVSIRRATAVADYLNKRIQGSHKLIPRGYGLTRPIDTNQTDRGRANNDRVTLEILQ
jgi:outer membrane protein OmpA-like peptidoglycan-associated protein